MERNPIELESFMAVNNAIDAGQKFILVEMEAGTGELGLIELLANSDELNNKTKVILTDNNEQSQLIQREIIDKKTSPNVEAINIYVVSVKEYLSDRGFGKILDINNVDVLLTFSFTLSDRKFSSLLKNATKSEGLHVISITKYVNEKDYEIYGSPVISYNFKSEVGQGNLLPIYFHKCRIIEKMDFENYESLSHILHPFLESFQTDNNRKAILTCHTIKHANFVSDYFREYHRDIVILYIDSTVSESESALYLKSLFVEPNNAILVLVNIWPSGVELRYLTDVVILRHFKQRQYFNNILSALSSRYDSKDNAHIWDCGDNISHFDQKMGEVFVEDLDVSDSHGNEVNDSESMHDIPKNDSVKSAVQKKITPIGDGAAHKDLLGRQRLIHVLKGIIEYSKVDRNFRPFVIGLLGKWGSGKSTVINLLIKELGTNHRYQFVAFNAWQNEHCDNMGAAIAHSLIGQFYKCKSVISRILLVLKYKAFLQKDAITIFFVVLAFLLIPSALFMDYSKVESAVGKDTPLGALFESIGIQYFLSFMFFTFATTWSYWRHPFTSKVNSLVKAPDFSKHLGISQQIKIEIESLLNAYSFRLRDCFKDENDKSGSQFIVVVDDLDRCSDEKIVEVLEAIRLIIDLSNVVVILAVDKTVLLNAIANKYQKQNEHFSWETALAFGRNFLGKILQLSIELDAPGPESMNNFVAERLYSKVGDSNTISQNIQQGKALAEKIVSTAGGSEPPRVLASDNIFEQMSYEDDEYSNTLDASDEYLDHGIDEAGIFSKCTGAFEINNPRTLVRIHNTITLLKGLYPNLIDDADELNIYIYLVFLQETYASASQSQQQDLRKLFDDKDIKNELIEFSAIRELGDELGILELDMEGISKALGRIRKLSLPGIEEILKR